MEDYSGTPVEENGEIPVQMTLGKNQVKDERCIECHASISWLILADNAYQHLYKMATPSELCNSVETSQSSMASEGSPSMYQGKRAMPPLTAIRVS